jgi:hypothetical protein
MTGLSDPRFPRLALGLGLVSWTAIVLVRVLPFLPTSGGDFEHFHRSAAALVAGESAYASPDFDYPPLAPVLLAPLGRLPLGEARIVWLALSLAAVLGAVWATWRLAGGDLAAAGALVAVLALEGTAIPNLGVGQTNPLLLLLLALALFSLAARPSLAAASLGFAAALKVWPGMLLLAWIAPAGEPGYRRVGLRSALAGLGAWALGVFLPAAVLLLATPPPHLSLAHGFWLGSPAMLNFSAPAAALRASYGWAPGTPLPADWEAGVRASWVLGEERQLFSVAFSLLVLGAGLGAVLWRLRRVHSTAAGESAVPSPPDLARQTFCALVALALLAAPISWYHYQLLQLPAFGLVLALALRERRWASALLVLAGVLALTRHELWVRLFAGLGTEPRTALYWTGFLVPTVALIWFAALVRRIGGTAAGSPPLAGSRSGARGGSR